MLVLKLLLHSNESFPFIYNLRQGHTSFVIRVLSSASQPDSHKGNLVPDSRALWGGASICLTNRAAKGISRWPELGTPKVCVSQLLRQAFGLAGCADFSSRESSDRSRGSLQAYPDPQWPALSSDSHRLPLFHRPKVPEVPGTQAPLALIDN